MAMYDKGEPYVLDVQAGETVWICRCGLTGTPPLCDGSHSERPGVEPLEYKAEKAEQLYVCGCGKTADSPWCDGSHKG